MNAKKVKELRRIAKVLGTPTQVATIKGNAPGGPRVELIGERKVYKGLKSAVRRNAKETELWPDKPNEITAKLRVESLRPRQ